MCVGENHRYLVSQSLLLCALTSIARAFQPVSLAAALGFGLLFISRLLPWQQDALLYLASLSSPSLASVLLPPPTLQCYGAPTEALSFVLWESAPPNVALPPAMTGIDSQEFSARKLHTHWHRSGRPCHW